MSLVVSERGNMCAGRGVALPGQRDRLPRPEQAGHPRLVLWRIPLPHGASPVSSGVQGIRSQLMDTGYGM
jgi:hypothetical protein